MEIGIATPAMVPGMTRELFLEWARKADASPFDALGVTDRVVWSNWEPLIALAAAAALTSRVKLVTHILMSTLRNTGILVKQVSTIDQLSNGRVILGLGVGSRTEDFAAAPSPIHQRGKIMEQQLQAFRNAWAGKPIAEGVEPFGPPPARPGGPPILMGGRTPNPLRRAGEVADGYIAGTSYTAASLRENFQHVESAWKAAGRPGKPLLAAIDYYALGDDPTVQSGRDYIQDYYSAMGTGAGRLARGVKGAPQEIRDTIKEFRDAGVDYFMLMPTVPSIQQFDLLADVVAQA
jgi:alkanesulfonate monooxygenase SsuD/methylene tetrahydromethanopterin reductase-like flavin-dependent oxidoreductase (luciferase family)